MHKFGSVVYRADRKSYRAKYSYAGQVITKTFKDRLSAEAWLHGEKSRIEADKAGIKQVGLAPQSVNGRKKP